MRLQICKKAKPKSDILTDNDAKSRKKSGNTHIFTA